MSPAGYSAEILSDTPMSPLSFLFFYLHLPVPVWLIFLINPKGAAGENQCTAIFAITDLSVALSATLSINSVPAKHKTFNCIL